MNLCTNTDKNLLGNCETLFFKTSVVYIVALCSENVTFRNYLKKYDKEETQYAIHRY